MRLTVNDVREIVDSLYTAAYPPDGLVAAVGGFGGPGGYYSGGYGGVGGIPPPVPPAPPQEPMTMPLPVDPPPTWPGREDRVRWILVNLTRGEKARLLPLLKDDLRHDDCRRVAKQEQDGLEKVGRKDPWT